MMLKNLTEISSYKLCEKICLDFEIEFYKKYKTKFSQYPLKNGKRKIKSGFSSIIVDSQGNEYPYMLNNYTRNDEKLIDFDYIYFITNKGINEIEEELGIELKRQKCKISEGGGWYSEGTRYFYKEFYCEI